MDLSPTSRIVIAGFAVIIVILFIYYTPIQSTGNGSSSNSGLNTNSSLSSDSAPVSPVSPITQTSSPSPLSDTSNPSPRTSAVTLLTSPGNGPSSPTGRSSSSSNSTGTNWRSEYVPYDWGGVQPNYPGRMVRAYVVAGGKKVVMTPDQGGTYPRIFLDPLAKTQVTFEFPNGQQGEQLVATALDGGLLEGSYSSEVLTLNSAGTVNLNFQLGQNPGVYRIRVEQGAEAVTLNYWAGPDNDFKQASNP